MICTKTSSRHESTTTVYLRCCGWPSANIRHPTRLFVATSTHMKTYNRWCHTLARYSSIHENVAWVQYRLLPVCVEAGPRTINTAQLVRGAMRRLALRATRKGATCRCWENMDLTFQGVPLSVGLGTPVVEESPSNFALGGVRGSSQYLLLQ